MGMPKLITELPSASIGVGTVVPAVVGGVTSYVSLDVVQAASGATPETIQSALNDLRAGISTDTAYSRFYRSDATFNGTVDHGTFLGYNVTGFGQINDAAKAAVMVGLESDYNDGATRYVEYHVDLAVPGGSFLRPFAANLAITGAYAGQIVETAVTAHVAISLNSQDVAVLSAATYPLGAKFRIRSLDTGGKDWWLLSSGTGAGLGAGHLIVYDNTGGRYGLVIDTNGNFVAGTHAAIATNATSGFLYVPSCAGTPTGAPTAYTGRIPIVVDSTNHKLYFYSGAAWRDAGP